MSIIRRFPSGMELILFFNCGGKSSIIISKISSRRFIIQHPLLHSPKGKLYKNHSLPHK